mmetsp:Transcript_27033/g.71107  ORF Transcript_27033/g.71107 Transcript_27033/m.71107 type:complete len:266 (-) Transcript_27033:47-844(-)
MHANPRVVVVTYLRIRNFPLHDLEEDHSKGKNIRSLVVVSCNIDDLWSHPAPGSDVLGHTIIRHRIRVPGESEVGQFCARLLVWRSDATRQEYVAALHVSVHYGRSLVVQVVHARRDVVQDGDRLPRSEIVATHVQQRVQASASAKFGNDEVWYFMGDVETRHKVLVLSHHRDCFAITDQRPQVRMQAFHSDDDGARTREKLTNPFGLVDITLAATSKQSDNNQLGNFHCAEPCSLKLVAHNMGVVCVRIWLQGKTESVHSKNTF